MPRTRTATISPAKNYVLPFKKSFRLSDAAKRYSVQECDATNADLSNKDCLQKNHCEK